MVSGASDAVVLLLLRICTVHSTDWLACATQVLITPRSGAGVVPPPETMTDVQMLVLLPRTGSGATPGLVGCVTVTQLFSVPPWGNWNENRAVCEAPGGMEALAVQLIGSTGPAPGVQEIGSVPPPPVNTAPGGAVGRSVSVSGASDGTVPLFLTEITHSTPLLAWPWVLQILVTCRSGAPVPGDAGELLPLMVTSACAANSGLPAIWFTTA